MADWSEVRSLANQLKAIQDNTTISRLSERTWVDIVCHLINANRLKLIFSNDGRSYLTSIELDKEIREEVEAHLGRITLSELASNLDIDLSVIESKVLDMVASDAQSKSPCRLISVSSELINDSYIRRIGQEILDLLEEKGEVCISELTTIFSLPTTFILNLINDFQGTLFRVHKYGEKYITDSYLNAIRSKVRGYFTAVIRPVTLNSVVSVLGVHESLLGSIISSLISSGRLNGSLVAGRGTYVPICYTQAEEDYVNSFFAQNGYIEWDYLKRFGIPDPGLYLKSKFPNCTHVSGITIGQVIVDRLKDLISVVVRDSSWIDIFDYVPIRVDNVLLFVDPLIKDLSVKLIENRYIVCNTYIENYESILHAFIIDKANLAFRNEGSTLLSSLKKSDYSEIDTPTKKSVSLAAKGGFGYGAREIKQKNVKKKYNPSKRRNATNSSRLDDTDDLDHDTNKNCITSLFAKYVTNEDLISLLFSKLSNDANEEVIQGILDILMPELEHLFVKLINSLMVSGSNSGRLREHKTKTEELVNNMILSFQVNFYFYL